MSSAATLADSSAASTAPAAAAVVSCYDVLDLCRGCGIVDFTEGKYLEDRTDRAGYLEAQDRQANYLLDEVGCDSGSRVLDIGCGYGRILRAAVERGVAAVGITISPPQVSYNVSQGLDVRLRNYRDLLCGADADRWEGAFDGVIANGSLEHFVQAEEAAAELADERYAEFFSVCRRLVRPGGRLATTAIHWRHEGQMAPEDMTGDPGRWPKSSLNYHLCNLHRSFGGWYPEPGQLARCAAGCFRLGRAEDGTHDYWLTSEHWLQQIRRSLWTSPRAWAMAARIAARRPRSAVHMLRCVVLDESWNYQFRPPAPTQLWRHTWIAV